VQKVNGRTKWRSLGTADRDEARRKMGELLAPPGIAAHPAPTVAPTPKAASLSVVAQAPPPVARMALNGLLKLYEANLDAKARKTKLTRLSILNRFRHTWGHGLDIAVDTITPAMLQLWLAAQRVRIMAATFNEYVRFIRQVFTLGVDAGALHESPARAFKLVRPDVPERLTPTFDQFEAIVRAVREQRFADHARDTADLVEFMGLAGVGQAEAANLRGEHIDFERGEIHLFRQKTRTAFVVPMYPQVRPLLERLRDRGQVKVGQPVFRVLDPKKALETACKRLTVPHFSPRAMRRMFIVRALERGVDVRVLARWQGHADNGALLMKVYGRWIRGQHEQEMASLLV
jgi:integrase